MQRDLSADRPRIYVYDPERVASASSIMPHDAIQGFHPPVFVVLSDSESVRISADQPKIYVDDPEHSDILHDAR